MDFIKDTVSVNGSKFLCDEKNISCKIIFKMHFYECGLLRFIMVHDKQNELYNQIIKKKIEYVLLLNLINGERYQFVVLEYTCGFS